MAEDTISSINQLTDDQRTTIHKAASEVVALKTLGHKANLGLHPLDGAGNLKILGIFASLKRKDQLRTSCGCVMPNIPLVLALDRVCQAIVNDDKRFPRISPSELEFLELELSILSNIQSVEVKGKARAKEIEISKHGLIVAKGDSRSLLMPKVAVENNYKPKEFLEEAARRANLAADAWKDEETKVSTFESIEISGPIDAPPAKPGALIPVAPFTDEQMQSLAEGSANNIFALLNGYTPNYYLPNSPDGTVSAIAMLVGNPATDEALEVNKSQLRDGLPLQSTLFALAHTAAGVVQQRNVSLQRIDSINLALGLLYDPVLIGTAADPDWRGIDTARRAVLVQEGQKIGWFYDPEKQPQELLEAACEEIKVADKEKTLVYHLGICCTDETMNAAWLPGE